MHQRGGGDVVFTPVTILWEVERRRTKQNHNGHYRDYLTGGGAVARDRSDRSAETGFRGSISRIGCPVPTARDIENLAYTGPISQGEYVPDWEI